MESMNGCFLELEFFKRQYEPQIKNINKKVKKDKREI